MYRLKNTIRDYAWGSTTLMSDYLGFAPTGMPEAEMWLGAHPGSPSVVTWENGEIRLDELIAADPDGALGAECRATFGDRLPFLMKVLAAGSPLSLQVHPTLEQAASGFAAEETAGVPLGAPNRNYKDSNHKPEMIVALTDFAALCGFRPAAQSAAIFGLLVSAFRDSGIEVPPVVERVRDTLFGSDEQAANEAAFGQLIRGGDAVTQAFEAVAGMLRSDLPDGAFATALATAQDLGKAYPGDPGVLISLMLNRVVLRPGDAVFLPAGNIHAYLHGLGIEVMASSDNVLRGGLTAKHIDTDELMRTVDFTPLPVPRLDASSPREGQQVWEPPFDEFQLHRIEQTPGTEGIQLPGGAPSLVLVVSGTGSLSSPNQFICLRQGESAFVGGQEHSVLLQGAEDSPMVAFVTTVPADASSVGPA